MTAKPSTIVVHDYFGIRGGGERLALTMAAGLSATLMYGFRSPQSYEAAMFPPGAIDLSLPEMMRKPGLRAAALASRFALSKRRLLPYKTRVFSGVAAPFAAEAGSSARNIYYCHTPPRFLYDQREHFSPMVAGNPLRQFALGQFRRGYEAAVGRMDLIVANSETVRERIWRYLGREAVVVYPPCDLEAYRWQGQQGFYLSTARHSPLKRVDKIVEAFLSMPEKQLIVASGGEDHDALRRLAADAPNITFVGWLGEAELQRLIGEAIATIYVPIEEDFGMSPVESMAAGKPVIGVAEGGLRETILDGVTGILLSPEFTAGDLAEAVRELPASRAASMRIACEQRAGLFSQARFLDAIRQLVDR